MDDWGYPHGLETPIWMENPLYLDVTAKMWPDATMPDLSFHDAVMHRPGIQNKLVQGTGMVPRRMTMKTGISANVAAP